MSFRAQRIDVPLGNHRRRPWTSRVADGVGTGVLVRPKDFAVGLGEANDSLDASDVSSLELIGWVLRSLAKNAIGEVHATSSHGRSGVPAADRGAPANFGAAFGKLGQDALLPPDAVALRSQ